jgi:hypothetical protein
MRSHATPAVAHVLYPTRPHSLACCCRRPALSVYYHHHPPSCPVVSCFVSSCPVESSHFIQPSSSFLCASCLVHDLALALVSTLSVPLHYSTYLHTYIHLVTTISPHLTRQPPTPSEAGSEPLLACLYHFSPVSQGTACCPTLRVSSLTGAY